jgi:3-hydroxyacyl-[acyl-carrier-protein] dehydratase
MGSNSFDIHEVLRNLPHRYPFLLIDRVLDYVPGKSLTAVKNVTINEPFFTGHFPHRPVMPGVLIMEALAQATGLLAFKTKEGYPDKNTLYYLVGIDNARFKQPVEPGDQLVLEVEHRRTKRGIWCFTGEAKVDGRVVASAELMCAEREVEP